MSSTGCDLQNGRIDLKAVALFQKHSLLGSLQFPSLVQRHTSSECSLRKPSRCSCCAGSWTRLKPEQPLASPTLALCSQTETSLKSRRNFINCTRCTASTHFFRFACSGTGGYGRITRFRAYAYAINFGREMTCIKKCELAALVLPNLGPVRRPRQALKATNQYLPTS